MRCAIFAALSLGLVAPALALQPPVPPAAAATDPARLAAAERLVALVMPEDAMRRMMSQGLPSLTSAMDMSTLSAEDLGLAETLGLSEADRTRSLAEVSSQRDPHFRERLQIAVRVSSEVYGEMMAEMMPAMVRGYTDYFARRLTLAEINELIGLFSTPTARKYTETLLGMGEDPAFGEIMRSMMPQMARMTARMEERIRAATAHLPPPPPPAESAPEGSNAQESEE